MSHIEEKIQTLALPRDFPDVADSSGTLCGAVDAHSATPSGCGECVGK